MVSTGLFKQTDLQKKIYSQMGGIIKFDWRTPNPFPYEQNFFMFRPQIKNFLKKNTILYYFYLIGAFRNISHVTKIYLSYRL